MTRNRAIGVFIVAEVRLYREGLAQALRQDDRVVVMGETASAELALESLKTVPPDVILLSTVLTEAVAATRALGVAAPHAKIIALAVPARDLEVVAWLQAGAHGFLTCDGSLEDLVLAIEGAVHDEMSCPPRLAAALFRRVATLSAEDMREGLRLRLTTRERQIMELLGEGLSNKEIAGQLQIQVTTVKNHVHNILAKLQVRSRAEAVARLRHAYAHRDHQFSHQEPREDWARPPLAPPLQRPHPPGHRRPDDSVKHR